MLNVNGVVGTDGKGNAIIEICRISDRTDG
jgi:hypothetical protein